MYYLRLEKYKPEFFEVKKLSEKRLQSHSKAEVARM